MSSSEKENVITGVFKNKVNNLFRKSTTDGAIKKREAKVNAELITLKTELDEQKAANIELNEQVEEQTRDNSSTDDRVYGLLNGMRLADAENEAFNRRKKVEILKEEFDAIDTIKNENATIKEDNSKIKKEVKSLTDKRDELYDENQMLNLQLGKAEMTVEDLQAKVMKLQEQISASKNDQEPCGCGNIKKHEENSGPPN